MTKPRASTSDVTLRDFRREDFDTLWQIDQACFRPGIAYSQEELAYYMTRRSAFTIVADGEGGIAGFLVAHRGRRRDGTLAGHIVTIDVLANSRRTGLGSRLLQAAEERLRESKCAVVSLETAVDNAPAISFYQRHGYHIVRTLPRYYNGELDALRMEKQLATSG